MNEKHLTNYEEWEKSVPEEIKQESVWDFYAYRKAFDGAEREHSHVSLRLTFV